MSLLAISDAHKREKTNLLATKSPPFGSHSSANGHVPHAQTEFPYQISVLLDNSRGKHTMATFSKEVSFSFGLCL